jgi:type III restriction enzyme
MALSPHFPTDPTAILDPAIRWYPGDAALEHEEYAKLLPPLVHRIRVGVKAWRDAGYAGASDTTRALLKHWFTTEHLLPSADGTMREFAYYFAQREAVESAIWLYEVQGARDPYSLLRYDSSGQVSQGMFREDWTRYVMKMATGAGKTKVMSLLIAWAYFHKWYEEGSDLSANFLLIAPNIIVLDRLRSDFDGLRIFFDDPVLPPNGYEGQNWQDDFQIALHVQDEIGVVSDTGNIFLTNIHRVFQHDREPSFDDEDTTAYFLGRRPTGKTNESRVDLGVIVRDVPDLIVINDEAHHIHEEDMAWFKNIRELSNGLRLKDSQLAAQFDLTATPKHNNGAIFVQTISDYPLVEAIRQGVVKTPVLPDAASRARLQERPSDRYAEQYEDYLELGYLEWRKVFDELAATGKKSVLFVMTDDTRNCDEVAEHLELRYPELRGAVLVIHTKNNGEISEASSGKSKEELDKLRRLSREIDDPSNPYKAIVSVMVLREGWDVQNVVSIVGLRPFKAKSQILPEQTLGRGLRRMFRGEDVRETVSVIGTEAFIDFVEQIKVEGVELEYAEMGRRSRPKAPLVIEVDTENADKDIEALDIELPILSPRIQRDYKNLDELDVRKVPRQKVQYLQFTPEEQRQIVFRDIDTEQTSHITEMGSFYDPNYQSMIAFFTKKLMRDFRLVGNEAVLFGKIKEFIEIDLFDVPVELDDPNTLRNLSEDAAVRSLMETFKAAINALTVRERGTTEIRDTIKLSKTRPFPVDPQKYVVARKSIFNKIVGDSLFELQVAEFLDGCDDIVSFAKNLRRTGFTIEYRNAEGGISNYVPDFIVKQTPDDIWVIETKGREDVDDPPKRARLWQWCEDASAEDPNKQYRSLYIREEDWNSYSPRSFEELTRTFAAHLAPAGASD